MRIKQHLMSIGLLSFSLASVAAPSINEMQGCQAVLDFMEERLNSAPSHYSSSDVSKVRKGLKEYNQYIQDDIISPGLLAFNGGDKAKSADLQAQIDDYKLSLVKSLKGRYPDNLLYMDHAITINNCAQKAVPAGQSLEALKESLNTIVKLSKSN